MGTEFDMVSMPKSALDAMLEDAAERGAKKALSSVGLDGPHAADQVRGLLDLFGMYRLIRNGFLKQIGQTIALVVLGGVAVYVAMYLHNLKPPK